MATTLPELLRARAQESSAEIGFLDLQGNIEKKISYADLYEEAKATSERLIAAGLSAGKDVVLSCFNEHENHIVLFWACCFGENFYRQYKSQSCL